MHPPFAVEEFFAVFARYNEAIWPMQIVLLVLALVALVFFFSKARSRSKVISWILAVFWAWMGIVYHFAYFASINSSARLFGILFLIQAVLFIWLGGLRGRFEFDKPRGFHSIIGWVLVVYGLLIYPILSHLTGHAYMASPTFGAPCPTTIFTFGLFFLARRPFRRYLLAIPILWSIIGGSAAFMLRVPQDLGLVVAGLAGLILLFTMRSGTVRLEKDV